MSISIFELFKIGIGPSSSHTLGPMIAAKQFVNHLYNDYEISDVSKITVDFFGSLGATGVGHGTAGAVMLGLEGDDAATVDIDMINKRIQNIQQTRTINILKKHKVEFDAERNLIFHKNKTLPYHSNGMCFRAISRSGKDVLEKTYFSIGGGFIVDEAEILNDTNGSNVINKQSRLPYRFNSGEQLLFLCKQHHLTIAEIMLCNESVWHEETETRRKLDELWSVMTSCVTRGCEKEGILPGGLKVKRRAKKLHDQLLEKTDDDGLLALDWLTVYAMAVNEENASGGRIVTAPTNGAAGIIPAVLHYYHRFIKGSNRKGIHDFLLTAAAIGALFKENASISGAEVGCQGEVGSACAMAAAGLTAVLGGSPEQIENAAEIAMEHHLGLTCDPIGGLVQIPCIERNAVASVKAIHASRMALSSDGDHFVSLDKVIATMRETGKDMLDKYKETSRGGLALDVVEVPVNIIEC